MTGLQCSVSVIPVHFEHSRRKIGIFMMNDEKLTKSVLPHAELYDLLHLDCMATKRQKKKRIRKEAGQ
jgi:hypothetical protein